MKIVFDSVEEKKKFVDNLKNCAWNSWKQVKKNKS